MKLVPIQEDQDLNDAFNNNPDCQEILKVYPDFYRKVGFNKPWIGYFIAGDDGTIVGAGGFKGKPKDNKVEIAYGTFKDYVRQGIGTEICRQLVMLSLSTDPAVRITARTLQDNNASKRILEKNGFELLGTVWDEEDGEVLEWEYMSGKR